MVNGCQIAALREIGVVVRADQNMPICGGCGMEDEVAQETASLIAGCSVDVETISICRNSRISQIQIHIDRGTEAGSKYTAISAQSAERSGAIILQRDGRINDSMGRSGL